MTKEQYEFFKLPQLRELAKSRGLKKTSTMKKEALIALMLEADQAAEQNYENLSNKPTEDQEKASAETGADKPEKAETAEAAADAAAVSEQSSDHLPENRTDHLHRRERNVKQGNSQERRQGPDRRRDSRDSERRPRPDRRTENRRPAPERQAEIIRKGEPENQQETGRKAEPEACRTSEPEYRRPEPQPTEPVSTSSDTPEPEYADYRPEIAALDIGCDTKGILEIPEGSEFGFIRTDNYLKGDHDIYVSPSQIRRFRLQTGDMITGSVREKTQPDKPAGLLYVKSINGRRPEEAMSRRKFESLTPIFPTERIRLERPDGPLSMRIVDLFAPIGKGQRGLIVSPPKAGKTTLLKEIAHSILYQNPKAYLIVVLIDERPEEVTDFREAIHGENVEVVYSTFDNEPAFHKTVAEMAITHAKRMVEFGEDVVILIDSITRLTRAYNLTVQPSGRTLSGGLDPASLNMPKKFFGAARNIRDGGSLTILATALVDTGSKMDDVVYEEFKGTGNMELVLDRKLQERRIFPAIDIAKSGTRREELLLTKAEQDTVLEVRRELNGLKPEEVLDNLLNDFRDTRSNEGLVNVKGARKYGQAKYESMLRQKTDDSSEN